MIKLPKIDIYNKIKEDIKSQLYKIKNGNFFSTEEFGINLNKNKIKVKNPKTKRKNKSKHKNKNEDNKFDIDSLIEKIIVPKISNFEKKFKLKYDELMIPRREHFEEYLFRTYKKYSLINTLVFKNEQRLLNDLYIPLTLVKKTIKGILQNR